VIGLEFVVNSGYLQIADANDIVVLFPQIGRSSANPKNTQGCWDTIGYDGNNDVFGNLLIVFERFFHLCLLPICWQSMQYMKVFRMTLLTHFAFIVFIPWLHGVPA
jgi:hypothetical protein